MADGPTPACWFASSAARFSGVPTGIQQRYSWPGVSASSNGGSSSTHSVLHVGAARRELAARRRRDDVGRTAGDRRQPRVARRVELRDRAQQRLGVRVPGLGEQRPGRAPSRRSGPAYITAMSSVRPATTPRSWVTRIIAMNRSRCCSWSRSRICACTVTSSAVVGSSAKSSFGSAGDREGDHDALAHAARQLVRVLLEPLLGLGDADGLEQGEGELVGVLLRDVQVEEQAFGDLLADLHHRVERGHRVLEHHRHLGAPEVAQVVAGRVDELVALEQDAAGALHVGLRQQAHDRAREHRLARPGLADDPERLAPLERDRDAVDGAGHAARGGEVGVEVGDVEQRAVERRRLEARFGRVPFAAARAHRALSRTSKCARTTSPR